jgi:uncharacterized damage-inducible protein DinB
MHEFFESYYDRLHTLHRGVSEAIADLPLEALDWEPAPSMNTLTVLVVHLIGAERYWIGDVAGQDPSGRIRSEEFETRGWDTDKLQEHLKRTLAHSYGILQQLTMEDLEASRYSSRDDNTYSVAWALAHALEHTALHLGHIQIGRELWQEGFVRLVK